MVLDNHICSHISRISETGTSVFLPSDLQVTFKPVGGSIATPQMTELLKTFNTTTSTYGDSNDDSNTDKSDMVKPFFRLKTQFGQKTKHEKLLHTYSLT